MRKPRIRIVRAAAGQPKRWVFLVRWPGCHWKNSHWWTFDEALIEAGVKKF